MPNEETKLQSAIQEALCWLPGVEAWRCNTARRGKLAFGLRDLNGEVAGTPDIIGIAGGIFLAVEVKLPGQWPTAEQEARLEQIRKLGGIALVGRSVKQVVDAVKLRQLHLANERQLLHLFGLVNNSTSPIAELRRALQAALNVWCPDNPGGDGADGETYQLCIDALATTKGE